jgi:hypothetical protein
MPKQPEELTKVIFRKWTGKNSGIIALFPEVAADNEGRYVDSYEAIGQHGGADYRGVIKATVPAKPSEFADLKRELKNIGYRLRIAKKHQGDRAFINRL